MAFYAPMKHGVQPCPEVVAHVIRSSFPEWRDEGHAVVVLWNFLRPFPVVIWISGQARIAVYPTSFQGYPIRAEIAFFEDMNSHSRLCGKFNCGSMNRAAVTEEDQISCPVVLELAAVERRKVFHGPTVRDSAALAPVHTVANGEIHLSNESTFLSQSLRQAREKRRTHPLQEQKTLSFVHRVTMNPALTHRRSLCNCRCRYVLRTADRSPAESISARRWIILCSAASQVV